MSNQLPTNDPQRQEGEYALRVWEDDGGAASPESAEEPSSAPAPSAKPSRLNRKVEVLDKPVYPAIAAHQKQEINWDYHPLADFLDEWYSRFNDKLRLALPQVPLRLDPGIRRNCAGYFRPGHNEFGLVYEIALAVPSTEEIDRIDLGDLLGTLLHEQLHLLQELTGVPGRNNYHNAEYRATAERFGLLVDYRGHQQYAEGSLFAELLAEFDIDLPLSLRAKIAETRGEPAPPRPPKLPGRSKLRKWTCGCTNVRVGVAELHACCTRPGCENPFRPV